MVELADTVDLKSTAEKRTGSNPVTATIVRLKREYFQSLGRNFYG